MTSVTAGIPDPTQGRSEETIRAISRAIYGRSRRNPDALKAAEAIHAEHIAPLVAELSGVRVELDQARGWMGPPEDFAAAPGDPKEAGELAAELRGLAEQWLYDGDRDQPLNDGYEALLAVADRLAVPAKEAGGGGLNA